MTREVEQAIAVLAGNHGRVFVKDGFADGLTRATVPNGIEFFINDDGQIVKNGWNRSVDWEHHAGQLFSVHEREDEQMGWPS